MVDLNNLVNDADMTLGFPTGINDRGEITGLGLLANGDTHAYLLIPCDENHPNIEGCDYSTVDESASVTAASSMTIKNPTTPNPPFSGMVNPTMRFFGHRTIPVYRNLGVKPRPK